MTTLQLHHIYPVIALVFLTFGIMVLMGKRRFSAIRSGKIPPGYFKDYQQREPFLIPSDVQVATRHYNNLFEQPVLFYTLIPLLILTNVVDNVTLYFSWGYVIARYGHAIVHVTTNKLMLRMRMFAIASFILLLLGAKFTWHMLQII